MSFLRGAERKQKKSFIFLYFLKIKKKFEMEKVSLIMKAKKKISKKKKVLYISYIEMSYLMAKIHLKRKEKKIKINNVTKI